MSVRAKKAAKTETEQSTVAPVENKPKKVQKDDVKAPEGGAKKETKPKAPKLPKTEKVEAKPELKPEPKPEPKADNKKPKPAKVDTKVEPKVEEPKKGKGKSTKTKEEPKVEAKVEPKVDTPTKKSGKSKAPKVEEPKVEETNAKKPRAKTASASAIASTTDAPTETPKLKTKKVKATGGEPTGEPKAKKEKTVKVPKVLPDGKRHFMYKMEDADPKGTYLAKKPKQAAVKAFSTISKNIRKTAADDSYLNVDIKFFVTEYKGKGKCAKMIPYIGTIKLLPKAVAVPIKNKDGTPMMVMGSDGTMKQKEIVYKFDNRVVRDRSQTKEAKKSTRAKKVVPETTTESVTESSAHTLAV
jgi:hypothetical protein